MNDLELWKLVIAGKATQEQVDAGTAKIRKRMLERQTSSALKMITDDEWKLIAGGAFSIGQEGEYFLDAIEEGSPFGADHYTLSDVASSVKKFALGTCPEWRMKAREKVVAAIEKEKSEP